LRFISSALGARYFRHTGLAVAQIYATHHDALRYESSSYRIRTHTSNLFDSVFLNVPTLSCCFAATFCARHKSVDYHYCCPPSNPEAVHFISFLHTSRSYDLAREKPTKQ
jgi:hypothetical protein